MYFNTCEKEAKKKVFGTSREYQPNEDFSIIFNNYVLEKRTKILLSPTPKTPIAFPETI